MSQSTPRFLSAHIPAPSRSPSSTSASDADQEEESGEDSDPELVHSDKLHPALATPKLSSSPWPYTHPNQQSPIITLFPPIKIPASSLPHEILLSILKLLPSATLSPALLVCKAWCQCGVELLWHKPSFTNLSSLFRMLLVISQADNQDDAQSMQLDQGTTFHYPSFVRRLNFSSLSEEMSDKILAKLSPCIYLERLTLAGCGTLSSGALIDIVTSCERLVALDLSDVVATTDEVLEAVATHCTKLQGLNLTGCTQVTNRGVEAIARGCAGLRRIKLRSVALLTDTPIVLLSLSCPLLLEVDLVFCPLITSVALFQLFSTSHHLRELSLASCSEINDDAFPAVEAMITEDIPVGAMITTANGEQLQLPIPLRYNPALKSFDHLRYLDLTSLSLLTDDAIAGIVKYAPRIRNLILAKCVGLTDEAVLSICSLGKHLHYLHMGHVGGITDRAVTRLARSCTRLRYIDLACCNLLTDMSVFELATNLPRLKRIGLVRVSNLTDQAIYALFARPSLERIHLSYCENVTIQAIHDLLQHLPRLTHLSLTGVPAFRRTDLQTWCRTPPRDFNSHQRQSFCVYSGKGVQELRRYLRSMSSPPNPVTGMGNGIIAEDPSEDTTMRNAPTTTTPASIVARPGRTTRHRDRVPTTAAATVQQIPPHNPVAGRHVQPIPTRRAQIPVTPSTVAQIETTTRPRTRTATSTAAVAAGALTNVPIRYVAPVGREGQEGLGPAQVIQNGAPSGSTRSRLSREGAAAAQRLDVATWIQGQGRTESDAPGSQSTNGNGHDRATSEINGWSWSGNGTPAAIPIAGTSEGSTSEFGRARALTVTRGNYLDARRGMEDEEGEESSDEDVEMG